MFLDVSQTWVMNIQNQRRVRVFEMWRWRRIPWTIKKNARIYTAAGVELGTLNTNRGL